MTFPVVAATNTSSDTSGTNHTVNLPTGITAGDRLVVFFGAAGVDGTFPTGWTKLGGTYLDVAWRVADGTEGATITVTTPSSTGTGHVSYRVTGAGAVESANVNGSGTAPNPPSLTPSGGAKDYLWLVAGALNNTLTGAPTNYTNYLESTYPTWELGTARRSLNAASEDPGAFAGLTGIWSAFTLAIEPGGLPPVDVTDSRGRTDTRAIDTSLARSDGRGRTDSVNITVTAVVTHGLTLGHAVVGSVVTSPDRIAPQPVIPVTRLLVLTRGGSETVMELPFESLSYGYRLSRPGGLTAIVALSAPGVTRVNMAVGRHELAVARGGVIVWAGPLLTVREDWRSRRLTLGAEGLLAHARQWHITSTLQTTGYPEPITGATIIPRDQALIVQALYDHHQAKLGGNVNIDTSAVGTTGVLRDESYPGYRRKNIAEAVEQLSERLSGFHVEIRPRDRRLLVHYPRQGTRRDDIVFDDRNIIEFGREEDATEQASEVLGIGAGEADDMVLTGAQDAVAIADYGLTQRIYTNKDVSIAATLMSHVSATLTTWRKPPNVLTFTVRTTDPPLFSWGLDDEVRIRWPSSYAPVDEFQHVIGYDVRLARGQPENVVMYTEPLT